MQGRSQMKFSRIASLFTLAMLTIATAVPAAHAQIQGAAQIQRNGGTIAAAQNMAVMLHDKIVTEPNASLTIGLIDNSSLQLGASATLTIDESVLVNGVGAPSKVGLLGGRLRSIIVGAMRGSSTTSTSRTARCRSAILLLPPNARMSTPVITPRSHAADSSPAVRAAWAPSVRQRSEQAWRAASVRVSRLGLGLERLAALTTGSSHHIIRSPRLNDCPSGAKFDLTCQLRRAAGCCCGWAGR